MGRGAASPAAFLPPPSIQVLPPDIYTYPARCWRKKREAQHPGRPQTPGPASTRSVGGALCLGWPRWVPTPLADQRVDALVPLSICLYHPPGPRLSDGLCMLVCVWG